MKDFILNKIRKYLNESSIGGSRVYLSQNGTDGFGYVMNIHLKNNTKKIGSIVFRRKAYLKDVGYPIVLELHIGFNEHYQGQGFFQDALIELYNDMKTPIFLSNNRVINKDVFKAINKLDNTKLDVEKIDNGYIISGK